MYREIIDIADELDQQCGYLMMLEIDKEEKERLYKKLQEQILDIEALAAINGYPRM